VGTLVANSVVVLENIFKYREQGLNRSDAASRGTKEVVVAVFASTMTNVAVFMPMAMIQGMLGQLLSAFAWTVVISTLFSILASFCITPLMASRILPETGAAPKQTGFAKVSQKISGAIDRFFEWLSASYKTSLQFVLRSKPVAASLVALTLVLFLFSLWGFSRIPMQLIPNSDGGKIQLEAEIPQGSSLDDTALVMREVENRLTKYTEVQKMTVSLGNSTSAVTKDVNWATINIQLNDKSERSRSNTEIAAAMTRDLSTIPGADIRVNALSESSSSSIAPISVRISGVDTNTLLGIGSEVRAMVQRMPGVLSVRMNSEGGKRQLEFTPNRKQIAQDGLTVTQVAMTLRNAVNGANDSKYRESGDEYDIYVRMNPGDVSTVQSLRNIPVATKNGIFPLSRYADVEWDYGTSLIARENKRRAVTLDVQVLPGFASGDVQNAINAAIAENIEFPAGYVMEPSGMSKTFNESLRDMLQSIAIAIVITYMLLAVILGSYKQPLFILMTVPLALIGIAAALAATRTMMNMLALIAVIMLIGVVVNNAILILDQYNQFRRDRGMRIREALVEASAGKLKAILMSNIAIILGELPMALGLGAAGAETRAPMGIVLIGGIISSTIFTLWLIPALELVFTRKDNG
jgi:HAE1 family hydrophobic/amphiphilic exporter-1